MCGMQVAIRAVHAARSILIDTNMSRTGNAWSVPDTQTFAAKATLHELCRVMGLPGKPDGMTGAEVEKYYCDGHIREIAAKAMCSTPIAYGSATNCSAEGYRTLTLQARRT
jgi:hypothetical protein